LIDIKLIRNEPDLVRENIRKKFQDDKLPLVDKAIELDFEHREIVAATDDLRNLRNIKSKLIGTLMAQGEKDEAEEQKREVVDINSKLENLKTQESELSENLKEAMMSIPNIMDESVPLGKDDSENVEVARFGEAYVPDFEIPYHIDIMERLNGIDLESARKVGGSGFYYFKGDVARLHSALLSYARDFMIDKGFTYYIRLL